MHTFCDKIIYMNDFKSRLKELRLENGYSQADVSRALGLTRNAFTNYELGIREPSLSTLIAICKFFHVTSDYLLGLSDNY